MSLVVITSRVLDNLKPKSKPYFIRDTSLRAFGVKVNRSGRVKYYAEAKYYRRTYRKIIGEYPLLSLQDARIKALSVIAEIKAGVLTSSSRRGVSLSDQFRKYTSTGRLVAIHKIAGYYIFSILLFHLSQKCSGCIDTRSMPINVIQPPVKSLHPMLSPKRSTPNTEASTGARSNRGVTIETG